MNAAARLVHQNVLSRHLVLTHLLTRRQIAVLILALMILLSALSIIYVTHTARVLHAAYQHQLVQQTQIQIEHSQLLLERSTWMVQGRIQHLAEQKLGMVTPSNQSVVVVHE
jgi:cell division protein FtsL